MTVLQSQGSLRKALGPLLAALLLVPLARLSQACHEAGGAPVGARERPAAAGAPDDGRPPLRDGVVASDDAADEEAFATQPYVGTTPLGYRLELAPGETLRAYSWDGGNRVAASGKGSVWIPHGELGADALTALYASFNASERPDPALRPEQPRFVAESSGVALAEGRTGRALRLEGDTSFVRYQGESAGAIGAPLTVELWWLPDELPSRGSTLVRVPGFFRLWVDDKAGLYVDFDGEERTRARPPADLRPGEWNRIALAVDPELERARIVLNDSVRTLKLAAAQRHGSSRELYLGKGLEPVGVSGLVDDFRVQRIALDSAELVDRYLLQATPGEHVLAAELDSGTREVRVWAGIHDVPELATRDAFARGELAFLDPRAEGLRWCRATWSRDLAANRPVARTTQPVIYVGDSEAFLFSGETKDSFLPGMVNTVDTWIYHIDEMRWERVHGSGPPGRCHQSAAYSPDHDVVLLTGGWVNSSNAEHELLGDTWLFHVDERRWERREPGGWQIGTVSDSGVVYNTREKKFYLFQWNSVLSYDPDEDRWVRQAGYRTLDAEGEPTEPYKVPGSPICEYDPDRDKALIFGGVRFHKDRDNEYIADTTIYDFATRTFTQVAPEHAPSRRTRGALAYDQRAKRFTLFGGVQDQYSERQRDLWTFDMDANQWEEVEDARPPSRRGGYYKMAYDPDLEVFSLLCGRASPRRFLNEAWRLRVDDAAVASARWVFDRSGFPELDHLVVDLAAGAPETVRVELESSDDAIAWAGGPRADLAARYLRVRLLCSAGDEPTTIARVRFAGDPPAVGSASVAVPLEAVR